MLLLLVFLPLCGTRAMLQLIMTDRLSLRRVTLRQSMQWQYMLRRYVLLLPCRDLPTCQRKQGPERVTAAAKEPAKLLGLPLRAP